MMNPQHSSLVSSSAASGSPMHPALIRPAVPADYERIGELTVTAYVDGGFLSPEDSYVVQLRDAASRAQGAQLLVAEVDGEVAASVAITDYGGSYAEVSEPGELEFRMLAVAPDYQGRGIARQMVRRIIALAQAREDIHAVTLCSLTSMTAAHALYRSEGFVEVPERDFILDLPEKKARFPFFIRKV
ncbi:GNAT family N-acetyltransferase [Nesterenkonia massiliensis]|uniref:GNAT family N-acetyltransferase n=1 Tax=Nesterenkonia massiliensis TaxID=1232429 RepID=A0ABT2HSL6_9MICC|nr:GNAT family N-acetyltransferase [Nesterenkonia massiliensis]MCT1607693.1 GNAT family N-acetyltransferase [Nesterenkonia massiliensis]